MYLSEITMKKTLTIIVLFVIALLDVCLCEALQWRCYDIHNGCLDCSTNLPDTNCETAPGSPRRSG